MNNHTKYYKCVLGLFSIISRKLLCVTRVITWHLIKYYIVLHVFWLFDLSISIKSCQESTVSIDCICYLVSNIVSLKNFCFFYNISYLYVQQLTTILPQFAIDSQSDIFDISWRPSCLAANWRVFKILWYSRKIISENNSISNEALFIIVHFYTDYIFRFKKIKWL